MVGCDLKRKKMNSEAHTAQSCVHDGHAHPSAPSGNYVPSVQASEPLQPRQRWAALTAGHGPACRPSSCPAGWAGPHSKLQLSQHQLQKGQAAVDDLYNSPLWRAAVFHAQQGETGQALNYFPHVGLCQLQVAIEVQQQAPERGGSCQCPWQKRQLTATEVELLQVCRMHKLPAIVRQ